MCVASYLDPEPIQECQFTPQVQQVRCYSILGPVISLKVHRNALIYCKIRKVNITSLDYIHLCMKTIIKCNFIVQLKKRPTNTKMTKTRESRIVTQRSRSNYDSIPYLQSPGIIEFILLQQNTQLYIIRDLKLRLSNYSFRQIFVYKDDTLGF